MKFTHDPVRSPRSGLRLLRPARARSSVRRRPLAVEPLEGRSLLTAASFALALGGSGAPVSVEGTAMDTQGNTYVTGSFSGTVNFGGVPLTSSGGSDVFAAKINPLGQIVWADQFGSKTTADTDFGRSIAVDSSGNVVLTGVYSGAATFGSVVLATASTQGDFVAKLSNTGSVIWAKSFLGSGAIQGQSIAVDSSGNIYTTGNFAGSAQFGSVALTSQGSTNAFVMKQDASGNVIWAKALGGATGPASDQGDSGFGIAVDSSGNVYSTGIFSNTATFGTLTLKSAGQTDAYFTKMDPSGNVLWADQLGGTNTTTSHDEGTSLAVDNSGNVYATGDFVGQATIAGKIIFSNGLNDAFVTRLSSTGSVVWIENFGGSGSDAGFGITTDSSGNVYNTGVFQNSVAFGSTVYTSNGNYDIYLTKLDPSGALLNAQTFGSTNADQGFGVAVGGPNQAITVAGTTGGSLNVGNDVIPATTTGLVAQFVQPQASTASLPQSDFNGVGYSQLSVFRAFSAQWIIRGPSGDVATHFGAYNLADIPVPGNYDGVGHTQIAVFRPSTSQWFVQEANGGHETLGPFGAPNLFDIPVPGDYPLPGLPNGDGKTELAVFRPSTAQWFVQEPNGGTEVLGPFGAPNLYDIPVPGDYLGLGHTELAVFRPSTAQWFVQQADGSTKVLGPFGAPNLYDIPVPGDYNGVGHTQLAVFRPSTAQWFVQQTNGSTQVLGPYGAPNLIDFPTEGPTGSLARLLLGDIRVASTQGPSHFIPAASVPTVSTFTLGASTARGTAKPGQAPIVVLQGGAVAHRHGALWSLAVDELHKSRNRRV